MAIELKLTYCLFLLTCFGREKESTSTFDCPTGATCWSAPAEEISTTGDSEESGFSILCPGNNCYRLLYDSAFSLRSTELNSIIVQGGTINSQNSASPLQIRLSPLSVVLDDCSLDEKSADFQQQQGGGDQKHSSFFALFRADRLRYLTLLRVVIFSVDWTAALSTFTRLDSLYIEGGRLVTLDGTFSSLALPKLRTLLIRSSALAVIDREAFSGGLAATLERLVLAGNQLKNALSLSVYPFPVLWQLDLSGNRLTFVPPEVSNADHFPALKELSLAGNRLKYYSARAVLSHFGLLQFRLEGDQQPRNTIYYTDEAKEVYEGTKKALTNLPAFYLDSLKWPRFQLPFGGIVMWDQLTDSTQTYDYRPDCLFLQSDGKLVVDKETAVGSSVREIIGTEMAFSNLVLDKVSTIEEYRYIRTLLLDQISKNIAPENAIRLRLFGPRMIDHLSGKQKIPEGQLKLIGDLLEDLLDEAAARSNYLILVLFSSADFPWTAADESVFPFSTLSDRYDDTVRPLLLTSRVARHSALIGFELMDNFMGVHPRRPVDQTPSPISCAANYKGIEWEMAVVGKLYYYLRSYSPTNSVLYGLSMDAGCKACFDLATMIGCRGEHYQVPSVDGMDVDFVTFISKDASIEGNEAGMGYRRITRQQRDALNGRDMVAEVQARAIFYQVSPAAADDQAKREKLLQFSSGYFVKKSA